MERTGRPRRRPEAPSAPTSLTEITRRYYACAIALAKAMGLPLTEDFLRQHRESISTCFIESGRAGVRLPPAVQLPPLHMSASDNHVAAADNPLATGDNGDVPDFAPPTSDTVSDVASTNGDTPALSVITTVAELPTSIPAGLQLPCAEALIVDLRPPQLSLLIGKVGLRALAEKSLEPLHVALLAERAARLDKGRKPRRPDPDLDPVGHVEVEEG